MTPPSWTNHAIYKKSPLSFDQFWIICIQFQLITPNSNIVRMLRGKYSFYPHLLCLTCINLSPLCLPLLSLFTAHKEHLNNKMNVSVILPNRCWCFLNLIWHNSCQNQWAEFLFFVLLKTSKEYGIQNMPQSNTMRCFFIMDSNLSICFHRMNTFLKNVHTFLFLN